MRNERIGEILYQLSLCVSPRCCALDSRQSVGSIAINWPHENPLPFVRTTTLSLNSSQKSIKESNLEKAVSASVDTSRSFNSAALRQHQGGHGRVGNYRQGGRHPFFVVLDAVGVEAVRVPCL